jgi:iron complex transport system substrate-binding protein
MKYICINIILLFIIGLFLSAGTPLSAKTVVDQLGRKVSLPDDPQRVVSLAPSITEIIFALGREHRLKGVTRFSDFPPEAAKLPKVGSYVRLDLEKIVALRPDLCFAIKDGNPREIAARLESLGIPVYAVDPKNLESVMETFLEIGGVLNATQKANSIVGKMSSRITRVKSLVANAPGRPRVFFQIGLSPIVAVGTRTFIHELIVLAGGKNISEGPVQYPRFSREQVLALSPEVFIITSMARGASFERVKMEWSKWPDLPAVRNDRILLVDSNLFDRPSPRLVDGLELLLKLIHPELFKGKQ